MPTHYEVLGVHPTCEQEVIDAAYKALVRKYHPDRAGDNEQIRHINAAYSILKSPIKRRAYDTMLKLFPSRELTLHQPKQAKHRARENAQASAPGQPEKRCPDCLENVAQGAQVCRHCGYRFAGDRDSRASSFRIGCGTVLVLLTLILILGWVSEGDVATNNEMAGSAEGTCDSNSVELDLGRVKARGTLELLAPAPDTDGYNQFIIGLNSGTCIDRANIDELVRASGESGPVKLLIGHDPNGTLYKSRSRSTYETDGLTPLSQMPPPPADMHFGEASWDPNAKSPILSISWYENFRQWQERNYAAPDTAVVEAGDNATVEADNNPRIAKIIAPTVPVVYRGRWAINPQNCQPGLADKIITEAGDIGKTTGDFVAMSQLSALSADMTFSMSDGREQFNYTERWTVSPDQSQLVVSSIEDESHTRFVRCSP